MNSLIVGIERSAGDVQNAVFIVFNGDTCTVVRSAHNVESCACRLATYVVGNYASGVSVYINVHALYRQTFAQRHCAFVVQRVPVGTFHRTNDCSVDDSYRAVVFDCGNIFLLCIHRYCVSAKVKNDILSFGNCYRFIGIYKQCYGRAVTCVVNGFLQRMIANVVHNRYKGLLNNFQNSVFADFNRIAVDKFRVAGGNCEISTAYVVVSTGGDNAACKFTTRNGNCGNGCRAGFVLYVCFVESLTVGVCSQVLEFATADVYSDLSLCSVLTDCNCSACYRGTATVRSFGKVGFCGNNSVRNVQCAVAKFNCAIVTDNFATVHIEGTNTGMIDCSRTYHLATVYSNFGRQCIGTVVTYCGCLGCCNY